MSLSTKSEVESGLPLGAHTWGALVEYEQAEVVFRLLKRISETCLRHDHLRLFEREEVTCYGAHAEASSTSSRRLVLFGRVRYSHKEALLALVRQIRLHAVHDLGTIVTAGIQAGDFVPHLLLLPLSPSTHTNAYVHWYRVYWAMRCGIFRKLHVRQQKMKQRLRQLMQQATKTSASTGEPADKGQTQRKNTAAPPLNGLVTSEHAGTLDFYTKEFTRLFGADTDSPSAAEEGDHRGDDVDDPMILQKFMAAAKETRVSLACIAATVPTVFVAWSCRYRDSMEFLQRYLFNDAHIKEILGTTGLSGRYAVLLGKDPWLSFAIEQGEVLSRQQTNREGFRIELLRRLPKRAQIVLLNLDADADEARAALAKLQKQLQGWRSPEVDLLSLWAGPDGFRSELATLFCIDTLPFVVASHSCGRGGTTTYGSFSRALARGDLRPMIIRSSRDAFDTAKDTFNIPDTPKARQRRERTPPRQRFSITISSDENTWHGIATKERARIAAQVSKHITQHGLPLCFTAFVSREFVIRNPYTSEPWNALEGINSSQVSITGAYIASADLMPISNELQRLHQLDNFQFVVRIMVPSAPFLSKLDIPTPQLLIQNKTHVAACANCGKIMDVDVETHARCLHCPPKDKKNVFCETCAFTTRCHHPPHILLCIPPHVWAPALPLLWGSSNVTPLAEFLGSFVTNKSTCHHGVYCNRCRRMIYGARWKCALCYQFDHCNTCARISRERVASARVQDKTIAGADASENSHRQPPVFISPVSHDEATHPMLYIPYTQGENANGFLHPKFSKDLAEWLQGLQPNE